MAEKVKKGIQVDPDIKKAYDKIVKVGVETIGGPGVQAIKGVYNYLNKPAEEKTSVDEGKGPIRPTPPTNVIKEGIKTYLPKSEESKPPMSEEKLGSLSRTERKPITNKPLGSQGPKQVEKWQNNESVYNNYNVRDDSSEDQISEDVYKGYGGG